MRITFQFQSIRHQENLRSSLSEMMDANERVINKRLMLNPEDDPAAYVTAYNIQRMLDDTAQFVKNANNATTWLSNADNELQRAIDRITKVAKDLGIKANNGTQSKESMEALAKEVQGIYNELFDIGNAKYLGRYLFAGTETNTLPFVNQKNNISAVNQIFGKGGAVAARSVFSDMPELASGKYSVEVTTKDGISTLKIFDSKGQPVILDSNGSDESVKGGNNITSGMQFVYEPGKVINTGRGLQIKLPDDPTTNSLRYQFNYESGSEASFFGNDEKINTKIGFNQQVPINVTGKDVFLQSNKTLTGNMFNSVRGLPITVSTLFSQLDKANVGKGDSIDFSGTDHNGLTVGAAKVLAPGRVSLDMSKATESERSLTIGYGGKFYEVMIPQKSYKDMDELVTTINQQLSRAQYAGSQPMTTPYTDINAMAADHNSFIKTNGVNGIPGSDYQVDLSTQIKITSDGGQLLFSTNKPGDMSYLTVTGDMHSKLGFDDITVGGQGKDTVFEFGYSFPQDGINLLTVGHSNIDLSGANDVSFFVNGKPVTLSAADLTAATTKEAKELLLDRALKKAGFDSQSITARLDDLGGGNFDVNFTMQNTNLDRDTRLASLYSNPLGTSDYQMDSPREKNGGFPFAQEKNVGDMLTFIENLYDNAVDAYLEDGRLNITDLRSGSSRMTMNIAENNQGVGHATVDDYNIVSGKYTGSQDAKWIITANMLHNADGTKTANVIVKDANGQEIFNRTYANYRGEEIELRQGVTITLDDMNTNAGNPTATSSFSVDLKGNSSLSFGDMNVTETGTNVNIFRSMLNLIHAIEYDIQKNGFSAPSAWRDPNLKSTAIPYFDGEFRGNFNEKWSYEIERTNDLTDMYVQREQFDRSGKIQMINNPAVTDLNFSLDVYDNVSKSLVTYPISIPLAGITTAEELNEAIVNHINNDPTLHTKGVHALSVDGKLEISSGSGTKSIDIKPSDKDAVYMMGISTFNNSPAALVHTAASTMTFNYMDAAGTWQQANVTVPAGTYASHTDIINLINADLAAIPVNITATHANGSIGFTSTYDAMFTTVNSPNNALGIVNNAQDVVSSLSETTLSLSNLDEAARTLTFRYNDGTDRVANIILDPKDFNSYDELIQNINEKLTAEGLNTKFTAERFGDKGIAFRTDPTVAKVVIEGDYNGSLGFHKAGNPANIKVTNEAGELIQYLTVDTANKEYGVSDGKLLGFNTGKLVSTDSFYGAVGSGISHELGVLDAGERQVLTSLTTVGTRQVRVDSVLNFHANITTTNENLKSQYLGSADTDLTLAATRFAMAQQAYQLALSQTSQVMKISILDYLR